MTKKNWRVVAEQERAAMDDTLRRYDIDVKTLASFINQINDADPKEQLLLLMDLFHYGFAQGRKAEQARNRSKA